MIYLLKNLENIFINTNHELIVEEDELGRLAQHARYERRAVAHLRQAVGHLDKLALVVAYATVAERVLDGLGAHVAHGRVARHVRVLLL